ncbi:MAG TPA: murein biosynthesis integral membrane protein MurJ [Streptosporangiaceae bacterium]
MSSHGRRAGPTRDDPGQAPGFPVPQASDDAEQGSASQRTGRRGSGRAAGSGGRHAAPPRLPATDQAATDRTAADRQDWSTDERSAADRRAADRTAASWPADDGSGQTWQLPSPGQEANASDQTWQLPPFSQADEQPGRTRRLPPPASTADPSARTMPVPPPGRDETHWDAGYRGAGYRGQPDPAAGDYWHDGARQPGGGHQADQGYGASQGPAGGPRYPAAGYHQDMGPRHDPPGYQGGGEVAPEQRYQDDYGTRPTRGHEPDQDFRRGQSYLPGHGQRQDQSHQSQPGQGQQGYAYPGAYDYPQDQAGRLGQPGYRPGYGYPDEGGYRGTTDDYYRSAPMTAEPETAPDLETVPAPATAPTAAGGPSLLRSSSVMALGTVASRLTGFLRTVVQVAALGTLGLADAYNNANTLPNVVYNLALGGILTSVIVPLLVNAAKRDADHGEAYDQRMFTLATLALFGVTVVATAAAAPLVYLYKGSISGSELHLMVIFAYFFIPQIFFYGVSSLAGAVLNARGHFAAPMWTPIVNNVVVIVVLLMFTAIAAKTTGPATISAGEVQLLGWGTTLGIVAQTVALLPALRRVGFRWRPRFDFRRAEVAEIRRMAGWMGGYVVATQVAFLVTTIVANTAGKAAQSGHNSYGAGFSAYTYGWLLFQLPYAVVGISVITALLPRMSAHATERRYGSLRDDFSTGVRLSSVIVAPSALILAVLGAPLAVVLFAHGRTDTADARYIGEVFAVFCLGLVPYMLFQLQLRVFYALHDSRTPALIGFGTAAVNIVANLIALHALPARQVVAGLGVGFGLANVFGTVLAWYILSRRLGGLGGRVIGGSLLRMHAASIPPAIFALAISVMVSAVVPHGRLGAFVTVALAGAGALLLYVLFAKAFGVSEVTDLTGSVRARLRR